MARTFSNIEIALPRRLRDARITAGFTQLQIANLMNMHRPTIAQIEAGIRQVKVSEIAKLAHFYGMNVNWFLNDASKYPSSCKLKFRIAAREFANLAPDDFKRVLQYISALKSKYNRDA